MNNIEIIDANSTNISEFGFCGYKNMKREGYRRKIDWLKQRFREGMKFKILYSASEGAVGFIEYIPGEFAWRAIEASGYMVIHCILLMYHKYRGKGYGSMLLEECLQDAEKEKMHGVAVVTSKGTWMTGNELFLRNGFESVDQAPHSFELLVKKLENKPSPAFKGDWEKKLSKYSSGLTIIHSNQCPYTIDCVEAILETSHELGINTNLIELNNCGEVQNAPSAYGTFNLVYKGKLLAYHPISKRGFLNIMSKELK